MGIVSQNASLSNWNPLYSNLDIDITPDRYNTQGQLSSLGDNVSQLNPDGAPDRYNTQGQLSSLGDNVSNINPDGLPIPYDTQGVLSFLGDNVSQLNPDGTPNRYNTQGILYNLGDDSSDINPDGSPSRYDTQGVLYNLGDASSDINPDGLPDFYNTQGVLGSLGDNVSQLNPDGTLSTYDTQGQLAFINDPSNLNLDGTPVTYNTQGVLGSLGDNVSTLNLDGTPVTYNTLGQLAFINDPSNLNFDGPLPAAANAFFNQHAEGFTIQTPIGVTQFIDPGNSSIYGFQGALPPGTDAFPNSQANGFTIQAPVGVTQFIDPGNSSIYGFQGNTAPTVDFLTGPNPSQGQEVLTTLGFPGTLPGPVDFITNDNGSGFTIQNPVGVSQFINNGQTSIYGWQGGSQDAPEVNNFTLPGPSGLLSANGFTKFGPGYSQFLYGGQTSIYGFWPVYPDPLSFFIDNNAKGFTQKNPVGISQFILNGQTSIYGLPNGSQDTGPLGGSTQNSFVDTNARGFTIKNPVGVSQFVDDGQTSIYGLTGRRAGTDVFANLDANGFTLRNGYLQTNFVNINANTYTPNPSSTITTVTLGPHVPGIATLDNQLGQGSSKFKNTGFSTSKRYYDAVRNDENKSLLASWATRRNSDSALDIAYSYSSYYGHNLKLRDTAFNPTYIAHPLILRGLQSPDRRPQRWGIDALGQQEGRTAANNLAAALDGGFIRGGAMTALERSAIDTARIAKFMASPKGIVWVITQVGLGKSNPLVEKNPLNTLPFNDTRSHSGLTTLLSVPGSAFGLHFTRHGIPFANEAASYEQVIKAQSIDEFKGRNRLLRLKTELVPTLKDLQDVNKAASNPGNYSLLPPQGSLRDKTGYVGQEIKTISGVGGPHSVYGIGSTTIKRAAHTRLFKDQESIDLIDRAGSPEKYYAGIFKPSTKHFGNPKLSGNVEGRDRDAIDVDDRPQNTSIKQIIEDKLDKDPFYDPGTFYDTAPVAVQNPGLAESLTQADNSSGKRFAVLPYQELQLIAEAKRGTSTRTYLDFRREKSIKDNKKSKTFVGQANTTQGEDSAYLTENIHRKYGWGEQGSYYRGNENKDVTDPYKRTDKNGNKVNQIEHAIDLLKTDPYGLANDPNFIGDKINAIDYIPESVASKFGTSNIYGNQKDFIEFYFSGIKSSGNVADEFIIFRATVKNINDSFTPSWNQIQVMGRPEGPGNYSTFERTLTFDFTAYASTREELVPMWRKLNYLSTFTMPVHKGTKKPGGPLFRITIGSMYHKLPAYFTGLSYSVNEEATWDLGETADDNQWSKQLPNIIDVNCTLRIIHDWRHQLGGRAFSLYNDNYALAGADGNWLWDTNIGTA